MPPKGWRKNAEGNYPQPNKGQEIKTIDEILFPKSTIVHLAKSEMPEGTLISKDSSTVLQRAATVWVNYVMEYARKVAVSKDRHTVTANDVIEAFYSIGFDEFVKPMTEELDNYNKRQEQKKLEKKKRDEEFENRKVKLSDITS